jgi:hypothetical protein
MGVGVGVGVAAPLFHTNFFPLLIHLYFLPFIVAVTPAFEHLLPGVIAAKEICVEKIEIKAITANHTGALRIATR